MTSRLSRDDLIEQMARAICEQSYRERDEFAAKHGLPTTDELPMWQRFAKQAAAALSVVEKHGLPES